MTIFPIFTSITSPLSNSIIQGYSEYPMTELNPIDVLGPMHPRSL